jgi:hypothetical protein
MRFRAISGFAVTASMVLAHSAGAQAPASPVQQAMRELMMAEERYYSDHGTYTTDISALGLLSKEARKTPQIWLRVYHAGGAGWTGDAQGENGIAGSCVAFVGDISNFASVPTTQGQHLKPTEEGVITCDP